jgi:hypothetical protein
VRKTSSPPEFDPLTVLSVASRYTGYAIPARNISIYGELKTKSIMKVMTTMMGS